MNSAALPCHLKNPSSAGVLHIWDTQSERLGSEMDMRSFPEVSVPYSALWPSQVRLHLNAFKCGGRGQPDCSLDPRSPSFERVQMEAVRRRLAFPQGGSPMAPTK
jgi:hypothetical protein